MLLIREAERSVLFLTDWYKIDQIVEVQLDHAQFDGIIAVTKTAIFSVQSSGTHILLN